MGDYGLHLLLTDEEFLEWCGEHIVKGCGKSRIMVVDGEEIRGVWSCEDCRAKAQLKKVAEWGDGECPHVVAIGQVNLKMLKARRNCNECWQSLLEEIK